MARFVVQWDVISAGPAGSRVIFENWLRDVGSVGLIADVGLTSYDGSYPTSPLAYRGALEELLALARGIGVPIRYVEAWNEPNNQGHEPASVAASFANAAHEACESGYGCVVIAGDVEDSPSGGAYEVEYEHALDWAPTIWGVHAYRSVEERSEAPYANLVAHMPGGVAGARVWITEVGARRCHDYGGALVEHGDIGQAERARWLVDDLIANRAPEDVFYYEFLLAERRSPTCPGRSEDEALYVPSSDPLAPDAPRPAANFILLGRGVPSAYTGAAALSATRATAKLSASVYPGGLLDAHYHFEYGTTASYGSYSGEADAGMSASGVEVAATVGEVAANTTYHYRVVAWNDEGAEGPSYGADRTFTTPDVFTMPNAGPLWEMLQAGRQWGVL